MRFFSLRSFAIALSDAPLSIIILVGEPSTSAGRKLTTYHNLPATNPVLSDITTVLAITTSSRMCLFILFFVALLSENIIAFFP